MATDAKVTKGVLWGAGALASFAALAFAARKVSAELNTFELMMYRAFVSVGIILIVGSTTRTLGEIRTTRFGLHFVRNFTHFVALCLWFYAVTHIPLAQLFSLEFTTPLWVSIFAPLILREQMTVTKIGSAVAGFVGILIIARPGMIAISPGVVAATLSAIAIGGSLIFTTLLIRTETTTCILFWLAVIQTALGVLSVSVDGSFKFPSMQAIPWIFVVSAAGLLGNFCMIKALQHAPATIVAPLDFVSLPLIAIFGMMFYSEPLELSVFVGAAVIFGANYFNVRAERRAAPPIDASTKTSHDA
jgi:drug/metabolite transporter (DMT)-like permease